MANFKLEDDNSTAPAQPAQPPAPPQSVPQPNAVPPAPAQHAAGPGGASPQSPAPAQARPAQPPAAPGAAPQRPAPPQATRPNGAPQAAPQAGPPQGGQAGPRPPAQRPAQAGTPQPGPQQAQAQQRQASAPAQAYPGGPPLKTGQLPPGQHPGGPAAQPAAPQHQPVNQAIAQAQAQAAQAAGHTAGPKTAREPEKKRRRGKVMGDFGAGINKFLDTIEPFARWLFGAALFACLGALFLLGMGLLTGNISQLKGDAEGLKVAKDMLLAGRVLGWACIVLSVTGLILAFEEQAAGPVIALGGLGLMFGMSYLVRMQLGETATKAAVHATAGVVLALRPASYTLLVIGGIKTLIDLAMWMISLPDRAKSRADVGVGKEAEAAQVKAAKEANMFSPCWKLPFCREVIRKQCPAFLAKKRCWKFGRGCYCDEEMISRIIRGETIDVIKAPTRMSREGKPPCGRCYIYLEHQAHKYRAISPLALPITIGLMFLIWPYYGRAFTELNKHMDAFWQRLSFDPTKLTPKAVAVDEKIVDSEDAHAVGNLSPEQVGHVSMIIFGVMGGFFLLVYVSKFIEWVIFKAKL